MAEPFPGSSAWSRSEAASLPRGAVALDGWMRLKGGGGGSDITPAGQVRSPTGAPGSNRPTGDSFPSSSPPSSPPPGGPAPSQEPAEVAVKWQRVASGQPRGGAGRGSVASP